MCVHCGCLAETIDTQVVKSRTPLRIQAARVGGVEIPNQKYAEFSLQYIFGIGHTTAKAILLETVSYSVKEAANGNS